MNKNLLTIKTISGINSNLISVTATTPLVSSGGPNPDISLSTATGVNGNVLTIVGGLPVWTAGGGGGGVTSVGLTVPAILTVTGSPITTSGTFAVTTTLPPQGTGAIVLESTPTILDATLDGETIVDDMNLNGLIVGQGLPTTTQLDLSTNNTYADLRVIRNTQSGIDKDLYLNFEGDANSKTLLYSNNVEVVSVENGDQVIINGDLSSTNISSGTLTSLTLSTGSITCLTTISCGSLNALTAITCQQLDVSTVLTTAVLLSANTTAGILLCISCVSTGTVTSAAIATGVINSVALTADCLVRSDSSKNLISIPAASNGDILSLVLGIPTWIPAPPGTGTVTSVGLTVPSILTVTGSPIVSAGTFAVTTTNTPTGSGSIVLANSPTIVTPSLIGPVTCLGDYETNGKFFGDGAANTIGLDLSTSNQIAELRIIRNSLASDDKHLYLNFQAGATSSTFLYSNNTQVVSITDGNLVTVSGELVSDTIIVSSRLPIDTQGLHLQWNRTVGGGEACIINQRGGGSTGGITFGESTILDVYTEFAYIGTAGLNVNGVLQSSALTVSTLIRTDSSKNLISIPAGSNGDILSLVLGIPTWTTPPTGTVTSVGLTVPPILTVTGSPVTTSGTFAVTTTDPPTGVGSIVLANFPTIEEPSFIGPVEVQDDINLSGLLRGVGLPLSTQIDLSTTNTYADLRVIRNSLNIIDKHLYLNFGAGPTSNTFLYSNNTQVVTVTNGDLLTTPKLTATTEIITPLLKPGLIICTGDIETGGQFFGDGASNTIGLDLSTNNKFADLRILRNSLSTIDKHLYLNLGAGANSDIFLYSDNVNLMSLQDGNVINFAAVMRGVQPADTVTLDLATNNNIAELRQIRNSLATADKHLYLNINAGLISNTFLYSNNNQVVSINGGNRMTVTGTVTIPALASNSLVYVNPSKDLSTVTTGIDGNLLSLVAGEPSWVTNTAGTVSSVGLTVPSILTVTGSPITTSGTLAVTTTTTPTGTGTTLVLQTSPTLTTPNIGVATGTSLACTGVISTTAANNAVVIGPTASSTSNAQIKVQNLTITNFGIFGVVGLANSVLNGSAVGDTICSSTGGKLVLGNTGAGGAAAISISTGNIPTLRTPVIGAATGTSLSLSSTFSCTGLGTIGGNVGVRVYVVTGTLAAINTTTTVAAAVATARVNIISMVGVAHGSGSQLYSAFDTADPLAFWSFTYTPNTFTVYTGITGTLVAGQTFRITYWVNL